MEKVKAKILGREYFLKVDDTQRLRRLIHTLEAQVQDLKDVLHSKSEVEIITLVALNNLDEADKGGETSAADFSESAEDTSQLLKKIEEYEAEITLLKESISSAQSEMSQLAQVKEDENAKLRSDLHEYESNLEQCKTASENTAASISADESDKKALAEFERSYSEYVKQKQAEADKLNEKIELLKKENKTLSAENKRLSEENAQLNKDLEELLS